MPCRPFSVMAVHFLNVGPDFSPFEGISDDGQLLGGADVVAASLDDSVGNIMQYGCSTHFPRW